MKSKMSLVLLAAVIGAGCFNANSCINQVVGPQPAPSPSAPPSPAPSPSASPASARIATVASNGFGEQTCPAGVTPSCADGTICRTLRLGCSRHYTCTALTETGQDAAAVIPNLVPSLYDAITGKGTVALIERDPVNPLWNLIATARAAGTFQLQCTVGGVSIDPAQPFIITVVP